ncbi:MAG TPA: hypothetical protein VNH11_13255 [Pirellulales bacterium]|nr:hypothetical protein [Pirellulales bacterium]
MTSAVRLHAANERRLQYRLAWWLAFCGLLLCCGAARGAGIDDSPPTLASSRDMLKLLGVLDRLDSISDDADFPPQGDELLWRMLYAVRRFSLLDLHRWKQDVSPEKVERDPGQMRGAVVAWRGSVTRVTVEELPAEAAERFDLPRYYRCELAIAEGSPPVVVYSLAVPRAWHIDGPLHARAEVRGLLVRLTASERSPVVVARRLAWYPETVLGDLDMDVGLFDELSPRPEWTDDDRECFYQLLAAAGRAGARQLARAVPKNGRNAPVTPLFNRPDQQRGRLVELTGTARQAVRVRVDDADIVARFGIDHYYEMEIFTDDSQGNPLTFCVRELPKGFPEGGKITEPVRVAGFFFKKWGYRQSEAAQGMPGGKQLAPLLIGRKPVWLETPPADQRFANGVFLVLFVVLTIVLWLVVLRLSRSDSKFHKQVAQRFTPPPTGSLNEIGLEDHGGPFMLSPHQSAATKEWVRVWKSAGPRLAEIERRELREMTEADRRRAIHAVLTLLPVWTDAPATSGLVEQQKWFRKFMSRNHPS